MTEQPSNAEITSEPSEALQSLVWQRFGLHLGRGQRRDLNARLREFIKSAGAKSVEEFVCQLSADEGPLGQGLLEAVTIGETSFCRHRPHFEMFHSLAPLLKGLVRGDSLRIWSAGCSTGEEAYSIAIALDQWAPHLVANAAVEIIGTDLVSSRLSTARRGVYPRRTLDYAPHIWLDYFRPQADGTLAFQGDRVSATLRFAQFNLTGESHLPTRPSSCALVFCRNLLIYYPDPMDRARILSTLYESLVPGGFLVLGPSDFPTSTPASFERLRIGSVQILQRPQPRPVALAPPQSPAIPLSRSAREMAEAVSPQKLLLTAAELHSRGNLQQALILLETGLQEAPDHLSLLAFAATLHALQEGSEKARQYRVRISERLRAVIAEAE